MSIKNTLESFYHDRLLADFIIIRGLAYNDVTVDCAKSIRDYSLRKAINDINWQASENEHSVVLKFRLVFTPKHFGHDTCKIKLRDMIKLSNVWYYVDKITNLASTTYINIIMCNSIDFGKATNTITSTGRLLNLEKI